MTELLQSTAQTVVGRGYQSADHISTATGLDPAIMISKNGGNFANPAAGASVMTEIEATGWYKFALGAGDTDTLGPLLIRGTHATMDNIEVVFQVVAVSVAQTGDSFARLGAPAGASVSADIAAIEAQTDDILTDTGTTLPATLAALPAAVWGYTTRTLTSLSALVASVAAAVWAYATRTLTSTAAATTAAVTGSALTITRATTWSATLTGLTISASWTKMYFTIKRRKSLADSASTLQIVVSNPADAATDGALYIEAGAATAAERVRASLTVDQPGGAVTIDLQDDLAAELDERAGQVYDVKQMIAGSSSSYQVTESTVDVASPVTLTV